MGAGISVAMGSCTAAVWSLEALGVHLALRAFHIDVGFEAAALLMVALNLSFVFPLSPGNIGTYQLVSVVILSLFGVAEARALAFSIALQGSAYAMILSLGGFFFYREGVDLAALRREEVETPFEPADPAEGA